MQYTETHTQAHTGTHHITHVHIYTELYPQHRHPPCTHTLMDIYTCTHAHIPTGTHIHCTHLHTHTLCSKPISLHSWVYYMAFFHKSLLSPISLPSLNQLLCHRGSGFSFHQIAQACPIETPSLPEDTRPRQFGSACLGWEGPAPGPAQNPPGWLGEKRVRPGDPGRRRRFQPPPALLPLRFPPKPSRFCRTPHLFSSQRARHCSCCVLLTATLHS